MEGSDFPMDAKMAEDIKRAGTGFMESIPEALRELERQGYTESLTTKYDRFEARGGEVKIYPDDMVVDQIFRFENASDPDDQAILYAISSPDHKVKGVHIDSYGIYHTEYSPEVLERLSEHRRVA